jgi:hypothetical protein
MPKTYEPIATQTLGSTTTTVTFSSIPATYTDLIFVGNFNTTAGAPAFKFFLGTGSIDTTTSYSNTQLIGDGSSVSSSRASNQGWFNAGYVGSTSVCNEIIHIMNYANTTTYKSVLLNFRTGAGASQSVAQGVGFWRKTTAINTVQFTTTSSELFAIGSTFTLYGIKAA